MLVISRRIDEKFIIGSNIVVTIIKCKGNQVQVGIDAPRELQVIREELLTRPDRPRRKRVVESGNDVTGHDH